MIFLRFFMLAMSWSIASVVWAEAAVVKQTPAEILQITEANLIGHQSLYKEGWFVVTSSEKAFNYAKEHALVSSAQAMSEALANSSEYSKKFAENLGDAGKDGVQLSKQLFKAGTELTKKELSITSELIQLEWDYGAESLQQAWKSFVTGNMTLAARTADDRQAMAALPGGWFKSIKSDFQNIAELSRDATESMSPRIEAGWGGAFEEARQIFGESYMKSGTRGNAFSALSDILSGYGDAIYAGVIKPTAITGQQSAEIAAKGATKVVKGVSKAVFLPLAGAVIVSGRTIHSTGLSLYYTTSIGYKLISPALEGGLLTGLSMLSYGAIPVTAAVGGTIGLANQIAVSAASPAIGAGKAVAAGTRDTGLYAAQMTYELAKGITKVTINQSKTGIVLGYNALTAIPTQLLLGSINGVVFLAYDGPRLVLASAKGEVQWTDKDGGKFGIPLPSLPVGSVVNLQALSEAPNVKVQIVSDNPDVIKRVLETLPQDLRVGEQL